MSSSSPPSVPARDTRAGPSTILTSKTGTSNSKSTSTPCPSHPASSACASRSRRRCVRTWISSWPPTTKSSHPTLPYPRKIAPNPTWRWPRSPPCSPSNAPPSTSWSSRPSTRRERLPHSARETSTSSTTSAPRPASTGCCANSEPPVKTRRSPTTGSPSSTRRASPITSTATCNTAWPMISWTPCCANRPASCTAIARRQAWPIRWVSPSRSSRNAVTSWRNGRRPCDMCRRIMRRACASSCSRSRWRPGRRGRRWAARRQCPLVNLSNRCLYSALTLLYFFIVLHSSVLPITDTPHSSLSTSSTYAV
mmetsp:Transcript_14723/g.40712  ORF Transcript_14723/g.40712 Transcript_14723/m.40712 type:complete len:309 (+) Transcript_14723:238-1164(+)